MGTPTIVLWFLLADLDVKVEGRLVPRQKGRGRFM
jgi:hypothetical protein